MKLRLIRYFFPDLKPEETKKFSLLALTFFLTIGAYWLLRLLKDTLFFKVCFPEDLGWLPCQGRFFQPTAKFWSPFVVFALVMIYSKLIDIFKKHQLFYIICTAYSILFACISALLALRSFYGDIFLGKTVLAGVGWVSYFAIESFGSLIAALFWSFTNSICDSESAKRGYPFIIAGAQIGAIAGSSLMIFSYVFGLWQLFALVTCFTASIMILIWYFMKTIPASQMVGDKHAHQTETKKDSGVAGFTEGIRLLLTRPYLIGIFIVSTLYEVINQIIEYQMKSQADIFPRFSTELGFAQFQGFYGVATNTLAFLMALLGTSYLIKRFGLRFGLLFFPVCLIIAFVSLFAYFTYGSPTSGTLLLATFIVMMVAKGLGYAVNNPVKEMMYIPTSKDVKFKTKGFTDVFGTRMAKMGGAQITDAYKHNLADLMIFGTYFSLGCSFVWILAALYVGKKNAQLVKEGEIVE
jgi:AAA family ATP:ADP antiporter